MLTREQLQRASADSGFPVDSLEKVWMLVRLLNMMVAHPFMGPRVALKGGTALNLFVFDVPRLSVDIDVNYVGGADRTTMTAAAGKLAAHRQLVQHRVRSGRLSAPESPDQTPEHSIEEVARDPGALAQSTTSVAVANPTARKPVPAGQIRRDPRRHRRRGSC